MKIQIKDILDYLDKVHIRYLFTGELNSYVSEYAPLNSLKNNAIIWARSIDYVDPKELTLFSNLLLVMPRVKDVGLYECNTIQTDDPYKAFFKILAYYWSSENYEVVDARFESSAIIKSKNIGENVYIGEGSFIDRDVIIGDNVVIQHNVVIQGKVSIGNNTFIQSGTTIGSSGFGYMVEDDGTRTCIPHLGGVSIGNNVRIGSLACIQRGVLSDTIIEDNVRIDNLCHISHNDIVKKGAMVVVGSIAAGSVVIGEQSWIGPGTVINDGLKIGDRTYTGSGSVLIRDTGEQNVVAGVPAKILRKRDMTKDLD